MLLLAALSPAAAQSVEEVDARIETMLGSAGTFAVAFEVLQQAVAANDAATVASLVSYPIRVTIDGRRVTLRRERDLIARYDQVFTPAVRAVVTEQDYADLFVNQDGVMLGDGEIWLSPFCPGRRCTVSYWLVRAINIPQ